MTKIFKYPLSTAEVQFVEMPKGSAILTVQTQKGEPFLWAEVDPKEKPTKRRIMTYQTGDQLSDDRMARHYLGTYQQRDGQIVHHVYTDRMEYPLS